MSTLPGSEPNPQARAVEIVADGLRVLQTRDGIALTDDQIAERARNVVTALLGDYELVPQSTVSAVAGLRAASAELRAAADGVRALLQSESRR